MEKKVEDKTKYAEEHGVPAVKHMQSKWKSEVRRVEDNRESSSTSSFFSSSNFTMSCSGLDTQEENEPSTSGCSSFLAHSEKERSKARKKARVKEYLKELKSIVQTKGESRVGTLSTLQHVLSSMRKIKDAKEKSRPQKKVLPDLERDQYMGPPPDISHTVYESDSPESLTCESLKSSDELRIIISSNDHVVRAVSTNMKYVLGYPKDSWIGRSFDDYVHKKDIITFKGYHPMPDDPKDASDAEVSGESKIFYFRLRKFKSLGSSGFSLRKHDNYMPFQCTFTQKKMVSSELALMGTYPSWYETTSASANSGSPDAVRMLSKSSSLSGGERERSSEQRLLYTIMYCVPLMSPYSESGLLPEVKMFETRQTLFCSFCHIQPNTIPLLGYLPQEMIGVSIFDFFHNDELDRLFNIYSKVIALKGVPYKSGPIRIKAKNGSWISCVTEWSSFVNPWSKRLEFIIGKHTVVKGPENTDVFSENFHGHRLNNDSESLRVAQQKIKDLLLKPVETVYVGNSGEKSVKNGRKSVSIVEEKEAADTEQVIPEIEHRTIYASEREKSAMHGTGVLFKENSISRAYDQLNYTNCIKKFLLSQPCSFSCDSDPKKSSSEDGFDDDKIAKDKSIEKWLARSFDDMVGTKRLHRHVSDGSRSLPDFNDDFWKKRIIVSDSEFDFDISVPKPPSFGSSTKVLVSEQEHRDIETLPDAMILRDQLQLPSALVDTSTPLSPPVSAASLKEALITKDSPTIMALTRESLWKHTKLQEQLYIATATPDRNILFLDETRDTNYTNRKRQRHSLKRSHSPDQSSTCIYKTSRHSIESPPIPAARSIMNPVFPLVMYDNVITSNPNKGPSNVQRVMVPVQMYPIVSMQADRPYINNHITCSSMSSGNSGPGSFNHITGMTFKPGLMEGFHQSLGGQPRPPLGQPIPVHQLNSYVMQQAFMAPRPIASSRATMLKQEKSVSLLQSSSESSSTEDTGSTFFLLESSENKMKLAYNQLVMQSLAQQMSPRKGLDPAPWLQNVCFTDGLQNQFHMYRAKHKRQLKKDREAIEKLTQPDLLLNQFEELLIETENSPTHLMDQENEPLAFLDGDASSELCSCMHASCCKSFPHSDHGIGDALKRLRKHSKKKEKRVKKPAPLLQSTAVQTQDNCNKMEVDYEQQTPEPAALVVPVRDSLVNLAETKSCSSKSDSVEADIRCDMSSDSLNSLNSSDVTPSDQRSNNENGSSLKESDGDAMSKKSDSSSSDKQLLLSESESESRNKCSEDILDNLFTTLNVCFPHLHKGQVPWLLDVEFNEDLAMKYHLETGDREAILRNDISELENYDEPDLVKVQLNALMEELGDTNLELISVMSSGEPGTMDMESIEPSMYNGVPE